MKLVDKMDIDESCRSSKKFGNLHNLIDRVTALDSLRHI